MTDGKLGIGAIVSFPAAVYEAGDYLARREARAGICFFDETDAFLA